MKDLLVLLSYIQKRKSVSVKELQRFAEVQLGITDDFYLYKKYLRYLLQHGHIRRYRKGLYSYVDIENPDSLPEIIVMASRLREPYYLSYSSALEMWGAAPVIYSTYTVSVRKQDYFSSFDLPENNPKYTINATTSKDFIHGLRRVKYQDEEVVVSSPARTMIDIINRPDLVGGWAELIRALYLLVMDFKSRDFNELFELLELKLFKKKSLVGRIGYLLEVLTSVGTLPSTMEPLARLRDWVTSGSPVYLTNRNTPEKLYRDKKWNIFIPMDFHDRFIEGQQIYPNLEAISVS
jgi:predicted transcriptional regulator of viral defense system